MLRSAFDNTAAECGPAADLFCIDRACLPSLIVLYRVSAEASAKRWRGEGGGSSQWESSCLARQKRYISSWVHIAIDSKFWMGALIWLNRHYLVVLDAPNVIRLKACLISTIKGNFVSPDCAGVLCHPWEICLHTLFLREVLRKRRSFVSFKFLAMWHSCLGESSSVHLPHHCSFMNLSPRLLALG